MYLKKCSNRKDKGAIFTHNVELNSKHPQPDRSACINFNLFVTIELPFILMVLFITHLITMIRGIVKWKLNSFS